MGLLDHEGSPLVAPVMMNGGAGRPRPPRRVISEFENEIRQLYVRIIDEPIPSRMINVLRAGSVGHKR
jgi:hypothetical protein